MSSRIRSRAGVYLLLPLLLVAATAALAGDDEPGRKTKHHQAISIEVDDDDLVVTRSCGDDSKVVMVDVDAVGELVSDALDDVAVALEDMEDMQFEIHLGADNMLRFADDGSQWEVDLNRIAMTIEEVLREGFEDLDTREWTVHRDRGRADADREDLQRELENLRREMKQLKKMLREDRLDDGD